MKTVYSLIVITFLFLPMQLSAMTGQEAADAYAGSQIGFVDSITSLQLEIIAASGKKRIKKIIYKQKEKTAVQGKLSLMIFSPGRCSKTMAILTVASIEKKMKQWMFLPALRKVRSISSDTKGGSLAGSEFSYEDLAAHSLGDYRYSPNVSSVTYQGKEAVQYSRYPNDPDSYYSRQDVVIDTHTFIMYKIDFYDQKSDLYKTLVLDMYHQVEELWRFQRATMHNHLNGNRSIFYVSSEQMNTGLSPDDFDRELLEKEMKKTRCIR